MKKCKGQLATASERRVQGKL